MMTRKAILLILTVLAVTALRAAAQEVRDSVVYHQAAALDSSLVGKSVFATLPKADGARAGVTVHQSQEILSAMNAHVASNDKRHLQGYRVRIFFDNRQDSRSASETAQNRFKAMFPGIETYRSYQAPFFKVTVGDFRTRSEAMELLQQIRSVFPSAFVVKENIGYPVVDKAHAFTADTLHFVRPASN